MIDGCEQFLAAHFCFSQALYCVVRMSKERCLQRFCRDVAERIEDPGNADYLYRRDRWLKVESGCHECVPRFDKCLIQVFVLLFSCDKFRYEVRYTSKSFDASHIF